MFKRTARVVKRFFHFTSDVLVHEFRYLMVHRIIAGSISLDYHTKTAINHYILTDLALRSHVMNSYKIAYISVSDPLRSISIRVMNW